MRLTRHYYNDNDVAKAAWLRNLIDAGHLPPGDVDERSIADVRPSDLDGYTQCHFFAGIGGWPLALSLAGWPPDQHVWTASCPCQPFSSAGQRRGEDDERHLWPELRRLIAVCRPHVVFGEQVDSRDGLAWLDGVQTDLEADHYALGAVVLPAASVGAPHQRHRIFWVADANQARREATGARRAFDAGKEPEQGCADGRLGHAESQRLGEARGDSERPSIGPASASDSSGLGDAEHDGHDGASLARSLQTFKCQSRDEQPERPNSPWADSEIVWCDEREFGRGFVPRRSQPGLFPLAARLPLSLGPDVPRSERLGLVAAKANRALRLSGYGDAIVPEVAARFIQAYIDARLTTPVLRGVPADVVAPSLRPPRHAPSLRAIPGSSNPARPAGRQEGEHKA